MNDAAISTSGRWIAYATDENADFTLKLLDTQTREMRLLKGHIQPVNTVAFSRDERLLASGARWPDYSVKVWDVATGRPLRTLEGHSDGVTRVAFSADGQWLASASFDHSVRVWDMKTGRLVHVLNGHEKGVYSVAFSPDFSMAASGADDGTVKVWSTSDWSVKYALQAHASTVNTLAFSPDSRWLATGSTAGLFAGGGLKIWDLQTGEEFHRSVRQGHPWSGLQSRRPFADVRQPGSFDPGLGRRDEPGGPEFSKGIPTACCPLRLMVAGDWPSARSRDGTVRLWDVGSGTSLAVIGATVNTDDWVAVTPGGLFDGSSNGAHELVAWRIGSGLYPLDRFFNEYYTPGLLSELISGNPPAPSIPIASLKSPPRVLISADSAPGQTQKHVKIAVELQDTGGGIGMVRLY